MNIISEQSYSILSNKTEKGIIKRFDEAKFDEVSVCEYFVSGGTSIEFYTKDKREEFSKHIADVKDNFRQRDKQEEPDEIFIENIEISFLEKEV